MDTGKDNRNRRLEIVLGLGILAFCSCPGTGSKAGFSALAG